MIFLIQCLTQHCHVILVIVVLVDINSEEEMLGYGLGLILLNVGMYFVVPAIAITKWYNFRRK